MDFAQLVEEYNKNLKELVLKREEYKKEFRKKVTSAEMNKYSTLEEAHIECEDILLDFAGEDCEGANKVGKEEYHIEFEVDGKTYLGTLKVEYNRHDKTYYYVDEWEFTSKEKSQ